MTDSNDSKYKKNLRSKNRTLLAVLLILFALLYALSYVKFGQAVGA